jgi:hypothetical protein
MPFHVLIYRLPLRVLSFSLIALFSLDSERENSQGLGLEAGGGAGNVSAYMPLAVGHPSHYGVAHLLCATMASGIYGWGRPDYLSSGAPRSSHL